LIKAIAVDKDGTFLNSEHSYDKAYFDRLFTEIKRQNIKFIVASGNQYAQLQSFFPGKDEDITYVGENGAVTYFKDELLNAHHFDATLIEDVVKFLEQEHQIKNIILSGVKTSYLRHDAPEAFKEYVKLYYKDITYVDNFDDLSHDKIVKVAMHIADETLLNDVVNELNAKFGQSIRSVTSGFDSLDLLVPHVNKGEAIKELLAEWDIQEDELLAFGDANNDIEMLQLTPHSYAMESCSPELAEVAHHRAPSNDDSGVLQVIEKYLKEQQQ
jgi:Cof subfamily protein (haloacid dehalogenase superfamily)